VSQRALGNERESGWNLERSPEEEEEEEEEEEDLDVAL
jgi:hypothetical protein